MTQEAFQAAHAGGVTTLNPPGVIALAIAAIFIVLLQRDKVILPFLAATLLIPMTQSLVILGFNFPLPRILIIVGLTRLIIRSEIYSVRWNVIDKTMFIFFLVNSIAYVILWQSSSAIIYRCGQAVNILGGYILLRSLIRDVKDIDKIISFLVIISVISAIFMLAEYIMQKNILSVFGSAPFSSVRDGKVRSSGPFAHPIIAGVFGALMFPLFVYLWTNNGKKTVAFAGIMSSMIIVFTSSSSTSVLTLLAAAAALCMFPMRKRMRIIRWAILFSIIALQLIMKAPVWSLLQRASIFESSTAYHRYLLVDSLIRRFSEWFLVGTQSITDWGPESEQMWDITNQFVLVGVEGGLLSLILFIAMIVYCFSAVGNGIKTFEKDTKNIFLIWTLGVMLFTHIIAFMSVSYFGAMFIIWLLTLVMISAVKDLSKETKTGIELA